MAPHLHQSQSTSTIPLVDSISPRKSYFSNFKVSYPRPEQSVAVQAPETIPMLEQSSSERLSSRNSLKRALSSRMSRVGNALLGQSPPSCESPLELPMAAEVTTSPPSATHESSMPSVDIAGPRFQTSPEVEPIDERTAGDPAVYSDIAVCFLFFGMFFFKTDLWDNLAIFILGLRDDSRTSLNQRCG